MVLILNLKNQQKRLIIAAISLIICFLFLGCHSISQLKATDPLENKQSNTSQQKSEDYQTKICILEQNRALWRKKKVVDYNLVMSLDGHGNDPPARPVLVEVRDHQAISIKPVSKSDERTFSYYKNFETVEKIFDLIQAEFQEGSEITVVYNQEFGYPENINKTKSTGWFVLNIDKFEFIKAD